MCGIPKQRFGNMLMTLPLVKVESMMVYQAFNQLLMIFMTGQYQTISSSTRLSVIVLQIYFGKKEHPVIDLHIADHYLEVVEKVKSAWCYHPVWSQAGQPSWQHPEEES